MIRWIIPALLLLAACKQPALQAPVVYKTTPCPAHLPPTLTNYITTHFPRWQLVSKTDYSTTWWSFYDSSDNPCWARTDINDDQLADYAVWLKNNHRIQLVICTGISGHSFTHYIAEDTHVPFNNNQYKLEAGVAVAPPADRCGNTPFTIPATYFKWLCPDGTGTSYPHLLLAQRQPANLLYEMMGKIIEHTIYILAITFALLIARCDSNDRHHFVTDIDGNTYPTLTIGNKVWMAQNLRVTHYRNGDPIPHLTDTTAWSTCTTGAYCNYNNDTNLVATYGRLYNWYAVNDPRNIAPEGWHIPTDEEINSLISWLEKDTLAANNLKQPALGGYRYCNDGSYHTAGFNGYWWSATRSFELYDWSTRLFTGRADVQRNQYEVHYGLSVRCVRD